MIAEGGNANVDMEGEFEASPDWLSLAFADARWSPFNNAASWDAPVHGNDVDVVGDDWDGEFSVVSSFICLTIFTRLCQQSTPFAPSECFQVYLSTP